MSETKINLFCHTLYYCHTNAPFCHTEGVARSIQKSDLQGNAICLDSSLSMKAQNDKVLDSCNDDTICHTPFSFVILTPPLVILSVAKYPKIRAWNCKVTRFVWILFYAFFWILRSLRSLKNDRKNCIMTKTHKGIINAKAILCLYHHKSK